MRIFVGLEGQAPIEIFCDPRETVLQLKGKVVNRMGGKIDQLQLSFSGVTLRDADILLACRLTEGSYVQVMGVSGQKALQLEEAINGELTAKKFEQYPTPMLEVCPIAIPFIEAMTNHVAAIRRSACNPPPKPDWRTAISFLDPRQSLYWPRDYRVYEPGAALVMARYCSAQVQDPTSLPRAYIVQDPRSRQVEVLLRPLMVRIDWEGGSEPFPAPDEWSVDDVKRVVCGVLGVAPEKYRLESDVAVVSPRTLMRSIPRSATLRLSGPPIVGLRRVQAAQPQVRTSRPSVQTPAVVSWEEFTQIGTLPKGGQCSEILKMRHEGTKRTVVAKIISKAGVGAQRIQREVEMLQSFRTCAQIIPFIGISHLPGRPDVIAIITEFAEGGSLEDALKAKSLSAMQLRQILIDVLLGLRALHAAGVIHRDIKPSNILLKGRMDHAFLCDLGASRLEEPGATQTVMYTEGYVAEEARTGKAVFASDIFSFGVVLREAVTGTAATEADPPWLAVRDGKFDVGAVSSPLVASLILDCVRRDPAARPEIAVVLERFKSIDAASLVTKKVGTRTIRFQDGDDPTPCGFKASESDTLGEALEKAGLEGRLYLDGLAISLKTRIGKLDPNVNYIFR